MCPRPVCPRPDGLSPPPAVTFANGQLRRPAALRFRLYRSSAAASPRRRRRRIVVSRASPDGPPLLAHSGVAAARRGSVAPGGRQRTQERAVSAVCRWFVCVFQVSETERLSYVGNNFDSGVVRCNSLCRCGFLTVLRLQRAGGSGGIALMLHFL